MNRIAFDKLQIAAKKNKLGAMLDENCVYHNDQGQVCAIGALLSKEQLTFLEDHDLNTDTSAQDLYLEDHLRDFFLKEYDLSEEQATALQTWHDYFASNGEVEMFKDFLWAVENNYLIRRTTTHILRNGIPNQEIFGRHSSEPIEFLTR